MMRGNWTRLVCNKEVYCAKKHSEKVLTGVIKILLFVSFVVALLYFSDWFRLVRNVVPYEVANEI